MFDPQKGLGVTYPILVTVFHQTVLWVLAFVYIKVESYKKRPILTDKENEPSSTVADTDEDDTSGTGTATVGQSTTMAAKKSGYDWKFYLKYIIPTAVATAGDVGFSNVSMKFVPLTIYTTVKSSSIAFVLLFSCLFNIEKFHWKLSMIVSIMFIGVVMMVYKPDNGKTTNKYESQFRIILGALLVLAAACLSGLRWVYTQLVLKKKSDNDNEAHNRLMNNNNKGTETTTNTTSLAVDEEESQNIGASQVPIKVKKTHPMHTIYELAPIMGATLFIAALIIERPFPGIFQSSLFKLDPKLNDDITPYSIFRGFILLIIPGICVFILTFCEFGILQHTKVLTLSIAGIVKEVLTIILGMLVLGERLSRIYNWVGMIIILLDVSYYNYFRYNQKLKQQGYLQIPADISNENDDDEDDESSNMENSNEMIAYPIQTDSVMQEFELNKVKSNHFAASSYSFENI